MKPKAIIFTSNTGSTAEYARLLGERTGLPVYSLDESSKAVPRGESVIYLGWLMAGKVKGYKKASGKYNIAAVCGVGMGASGSQLDEVRKANAISAKTPLFTLQGGFEMDKLHGIYKFMMKTMQKTAGKALENKKDITPEESEMLDLLKNGGSRVSAGNLDGVINWFEKIK